MLCLFLYIYITIYKWFTFLSKYHLVSLCFSCCYLQSFTFESQEQKVVFEFQTISIFVSKQFFDFYNFSEKLP